MKLRAAFSLITFLLLSATLSYAQPYKSAIGARLGYPWSLSYKTFLNENNAFEVYGGARFYGLYGWLGLSGAYLRHTPLDLGLDGTPSNYETSSNLSWYWGVGGSVYFWNTTLINSPLDNTTTFGVQGYLGLEYALTDFDIPLSLTFDWVPTFLLQTNYSISAFRGLYGGVGIRYILKE